MSEEMSGPQFKKVGCKRQGVRVKTVADRKGNTWCRVLYGEM